MKCHDHIIRVRLKAYPTNIFNRTNCANDLNSSNSGTAPRQEAPPTHPNPKKAATTKFNRILTRHNTTCRSFTPPSRICRSKSPTSSRPKQFPDNSHGKLVADQCVCVFHCRVLRTSILFQALSTPGPREPVPFTPPVLEVSERFDEIQHMLSYLLKAGIQCTVPFLSRSSSPARIRCIAHSCSPARIRSKPLVSHPAIYKLTDGSTSRHTAIQLILAAFSIASIVWSGLSKHFLSRA